MISSENPRDRLLKLVLAFSNPIKFRKEIKEETKPIQIIDNDPKIVKLGLKREKGWLYFIDKEGDIARTKMNRGGSKKKKVKKKEITTKPTKKKQAKKKTPKKAVTKKKTIKKKQPQEKVPLIQVNIQDNSKNIHIDKKEELHRRIEKLENALSLITNVKDKQKHDFLKSKIEEMKKKLN